MTELVRAGEQQVSPVIDQSTPLAMPQAELLAYVEEKWRAAKEALEEVEAAWRYAKKQKWATKALAGIASRDRKRVEYLEKVVAAVKAGYVIMPPVWGDVFAVRVGDKAVLREHTTKNPNSWQRPGDQLPNVESDAPALGEGEYVAPEPTFHCEYFQREENGQVVKYRKEIGDGFVFEIPFPVSMAKPVLMEATERAMALKIFDDIAILPGRRRRKADPIIYGRILRKGKEPLCFLICWLMRREDI